MLALLKNLNNIQDLEDLIRLSKYSTNSVQDYLSDKFTSLNCKNDDFNYFSQNGDSNDNDKEKRDNYCKWVLLSIENTWH